MDNAIKKSANRLKEILQKDIHSVLKERDIIGDLDKDVYDKVKLKVLSNDIFVQLFDGIDKATDDFLIREFHNIMKDFIKGRLENMITECVNKLQNEMIEFVKCAKENVQQDDDDDDDDDDNQPSFAERLQAHLNTGQKQSKKRSLSESSSSSQENTTTRSNDELNSKKRALRCLCYVTCGSSQEPIKLNALKQKAERNNAKPYVIQKYRDYKKIFKTETQASNVEIYFKQCSNKRGASINEKYKPCIETNDRFSVKNKFITPCICCFHAGVTDSKGKKKCVTNTRKQIYFGWLYSLKCAIEQYHSRGFRKFGLKTFGTKNIKWDKSVAVCCSEIGGMSCDACLERSRPNSAVKVSAISKEFPEFQHLTMKSYGANIHAFNVLEILCRNRKSKRKQEFTIGEHLTGIYLKENDTTKELYLDTTQQKVFDDFEVAKNIMQLGNGNSKKG